MTPTMYCDNCGASDQEAPLTLSSGPLTGKPVLLCPECLEDDPG